MTDKIKCMTCHSCMKCEHCIRIDERKMVLQSIKRMIKERENPYPKDIFRWNNKDKLGFNRGRFNSFIFEVVENTRNDFLRKIEEFLDEVRECQ